MNSHHPHQASTSGIPSLASLHHQPFSHHPNAITNPPNILQEYDRLLLCFMYDCLRRQGLNHTADVLAGEADLPLDQSGYIVERLSAAANKNVRIGRQAGFLAAWWGTFIELYLGRNGIRIGDVTVGRRSMQAWSLAPPLPSSIAAQMPPFAQQQTSFMPPHPPPPPLTPYPTPVTESERRAMVHMIMQSLGLQGREPASLTPEERSMIVGAMQRAGIPMQSPNMVSMRATPLIMRRSRRAKRRVWSSRTLRTCRPCRA